MINDAILAGRSYEHLVLLGEGPHRLQAEAAQAFNAMQQAAKQAGFNLQPVSSFRDFPRQLLIWNEKFNGLRPVVDENNQPIDLQGMNEGERCLAILRWSALPGASRHHWGTDVDIYDPDLLPEGQKLCLEPWEYQRDGYFYNLNQWITGNMGEFGFFRPFVNAKYIANEPWHLSYAPLALQLQSLLTPQHLLTAWSGESIAGFNWLSQNLDTLFGQFINPINKESQ